MAIAQSEVPTRPRSRKWVKVGITSAIVISALVYWFAPDRLYIPGTALYWSPPWRDASQRADEAKAPACAPQAPDTTPTNDVPHVGDCVTYTPQNSDADATTDRFADVADLLAGTADRIHSPDDQIRVSQELAAAKKLTLAETRHQEDKIAASLIFTAAKETLPGVSDDEILNDIRTIPHLQITREDVGAKLVIAHAGLLSTDAQEISDASPASLRSSDESSAGNSPRSAVTRNRDAGAQGDPRATSAPARAVRAPAIDGCTVTDNAGVPVALNAIVLDGFTARQIADDCRARIAHGVTSETDAL